MSIKKRNRVALRKLRKLGFFMPRVRKALFDLNDIKVGELAGELGFSKPTLYAALNGTWTSSRVKEALAERLLIPVSELFPDE